MNLHMNLTAPRPLDPLSAFALAFAVAAIFSLTSRYPGYVHHDTAEIGMWSTLGWPLGLPKHPPFLPWLFRAYSYLLPLNWISIGLLTAGNIALGAWAVWRIGVSTSGEHRAAVAIILYALAPAGTFFALKLNHNAILVSLWPLTILAFLTCLRADTARRSIAAGLVFGALAAAAILAKYYSGVLLASCFAASLVSARRNRFYTMPGGYVAIAVFMLLIAPHVWWMWASRGATLSYAFHETERDTHPLAHFLLLAPAYLLPPVAVFIALRRWLPTLPQAPTHEAVRTSADGGARELWVLALGPYVLTAAFIAAFNLRGATSWSLPDFCVVPVLLARALPEVTGAALGTLKRWARAGLAVLALAGPVVLFAAFASGDSNAVEPRAEAARAAGLIWEKATQRPVTLVAGDPQSANAAALELPSRPLAFTNFSAAFAPWVTPQALASGGLLVICRLSYSGCQQQALAAAQGHSGFVCALSLRRRLLWLTGRPLAIEVSVVMPGGTSATSSAASAACEAGGDGARLVKMYEPPG
jgi:hypothetical protein